MKDIKNYLRNNWEIIILLIIIIIYTVSLINLYSGFKQLPSPLYGGDYYHQLGAINHVKEGGNAFKSFSTEGPTPTYFPAYTFFAGNFVKLLDLDPMQGMYAFSIIVMIFSAIIVYLLFKEIFENKYAGLISVLIYLPLKVGVLKYTEFTRYLIYPLFLLFLVKFFKSKKIKDKYMYSVLVGLMFGITTLSHGTGFILSVILMFSVGLYLLFLQHFDIKTKKFNKKSLKKKFKQNLIYFLMMSLIGFLLSLVYWLPVIKMFLQGSLNNYSITPYIFNVPIVLNYIFNRLLNFSSLNSILIRILVLLSIILCLIINKSDKKVRAIIISSVIIFILPLHIIITKPLLGFTLIPNHMISHLYPIMLTLLAGLFVYIITKIKMFKFKNIVLLGIILLLLISNISSFNNYKDNNKWTKTGRSELSPYLKLVSKWIKDNTEVEDMFISTKETGSAINALTGRKFLALRFNHVTTWADVMQREADLAVILYGNDDSKREELLKKYNVNYLYWDYYWFRSEFIFNNQGQLVSYFDPIMVRNNQRYRNYFSKYNISYIESKMSTDPSKRDRDDVKKPEVLIVIPSNMNVTHPWSNKLDKYLELKKQILSQGQAIAKVYKIDN